MGAGGAGLTGMKRPDWLGGGRRGRLLHACSKQLWRTCADGPSTMVAAVGMHHLNEVRPAYPPHAVLPAALNALPPSPPRPA